MTRADPRSGPLAVRPATAALLSVLVPGIVACAGPREGDPALSTVPADSLPVALHALPDTAAWAVPAAEAVGDTMFARAGGDYRIPALGPDGRRVAFADVARSDGSVRSRVLVADLGTDSARVLLGRERVAEYGVGPYDSWVIGLSWRGADTLEARIADGDVGTTTVLLDPADGALLSERYEQGEPSAELPDDEAELRERILGAFPEWRREVVTSAFRMGQVVEGPGGVVIQKRYAREDANVRWLGWTEGDTSLLLEMPRELDRRGDLRPGLAVGGRLLFPLLEHDRAHLFDLRPGRTLRWWGSVPAGGGHFTRLREVARAGDTVVAQLDVASGSECCLHEPVLRVTPESLVAWSLEGPVSGLDASLAHGLVAWTRWMTPDSVRRLTVIRLAR